MQRLLDLGADPDWIPPNGYSVLEHVIWRCWNGEVVDLIAARVKPREAFWIAAGLGDATAVKRYVDENACPRTLPGATARTSTPLGHMPWPTIRALTTRESSGRLHRRRVQPTVSRAGRPARSWVSDRLLAMGSDHSSPRGWQRMGTRWWSTWSSAARTSNLKGWRPYRQREKPPNRRR